MGKWTSFVMIKRATIIYMAVMFILNGCDKFMSDAVWTQVSTVTVTVNGADLDKCLSLALENVPNVKIDRTQSEPGNIVLNVKLEKSIPLMGVYVRNLNANTIQVMFAARGSHESDDERARITPFLTLITNSIKAQCSRP